MGTLVGIIAFLFLAYHYSIGLLRAFFSFFSLFVPMYFAGLLTNNYDLDPVLSLFIIFVIMLILLLIIKSLTPNHNK